MKTRSAKRVSLSPTREEEVQNATRRSGSKRQKLVTITNSKLSDVKQCEPNMDKVMKHVSDSSDSSSDEYLKPPELIDLNSDYFKIKKEPPSDFSAIENNIFDGIQRLTDSDDSDFEEVGSQNFHKTGLKNSVKNVTSMDSPLEIKPLKHNSTPQKKSNSRSKKTTLRLKQTKVRSNVKQNDTYLRGKLQGNHTDTKFDAPEVNKMNVSQLLALGEGPSDNNVEISKFTSESENELTDWEEVKGDVKPELVEHSIPKEGVVVTLQMPELYRKHKKKGFDMEAFMKRRVNQAKRAFQVLIHKVNLLCWIAHGRHVNSILNSEVLMGISLSLIPSQHCYPKGRTDINYLEQILKWFVKTVPITEEPCDTKNTTELLCESLIKQFECSTAKSKRDLVLMFICLLRSLGVTARLVISLQPLPLKPEHHELCSIQVKKEKTPSKNTKCNDDVKKNAKHKVSPSDKSSKIKEPAVNKVTRKKPNVMSKEEAIARIKDANEKKKNSETPKTKRTVKILATSNTLLNDSNVKEKNDKEVTNKNRSSRRLKDVKGMVHKYKEDSESSEEDILLLQNKRLESKKSNKNSDKESSTSSKAKVNCKTNSNRLSNSFQSSTEKLKVNNNANKSKINNDDDDDFLPEPSTSQQKKSMKQKTVKQEHSSDSDFEPESLNSKNRSNNLVAKKKLDRSVMSSDLSEGVDKKKKKGVDVWTEVYLESEETWISVDVPRGKVHCASELYSRATHPVTYVIAWNIDLSLKDVTRRYCTQFHTSTRKQRVEAEWWEETLKPFLVRRTARDREEDEELDRQLEDRPLPTSFSEYKNHPLYVLKKDLLKFEAIYPSDAPTLGFVRGHAIYARQCVHSLHSRETWVKDAKVVRLGEQPYKIVKARPKYDRMTGQVVSNLPLEVFGEWQTEDYVPPPAVNGKIPRNPYGNVELFKPCMLPKGTVHLQVPGLNRVARKLGIDCAPAMIGFDYHSGGSHPTYDGFVVCEEFKDTILDAWNQEQDEAEKRQQEKRDKRVYGNWRRLIKGLLIRERLKQRYSFGDPGPSKTKSKKSGKLKVSNKRRKIESEDDSDWATE